MDLRELAEDILSIYEDMDTYELKDTFNDKKEAYDFIFYALRKWSAEDIRESIINNLQKFIDDGYGTKQMADVIQRLNELAEARE